ncbi:MAG: XRE family transcriptional regulator [Pseudanabaena sp. CAN_BIN31]|nr:XRE family transcriptional regulator [Pseudanabaena sp. CAN_BIN31]
MSILFKENPSQRLSTSAIGAMRHPRNHSLIGSRIFMIRPTTSTFRETAYQELRAAVDMTTSGITLPSASSPEATQKALGELRRLSGLTWEQLAKLFNVSRRSLHFWASGQPLSRFNEEQLNRLLGTIQYINRGSASLNRSLLLKPDDNGNPLFDLLVAGKHKEFKQLVGAGNALQKLQFGSLSEDVYSARMPQNPSHLIDALQYPIHQEVGQSRPARTARSRKNISGQ